MSKGIFFEIGAAGFFAQFLLEDNWHERGYGYHEELPMLAPARYKKFYDTWEVYAVEPFFMNMYAAEPFLQKENAHLIQAAIGGKNKYLSPLRVIDMSTNPDWGTPAHGLSSQAEGTFLLGEDKKNIGYCDDLFTLYISTITLDTLFESLNAYPDILRIDIEGTEIEALNAYSFKPRPRMIQVDHHSVNRDAVVNILTKNDYLILDTEWNGGGDKADVIAECKHTL